MTKRKREPAVATGKSEKAAGEVPRKAVKATTAHQTENEGVAATIQIVTGSYERVLHGFTAALPTRPPTINTLEDNKIEPSSSTVNFSDTFLFSAHTSSIRSLALSPLDQADPSQPQNLILASGGSDERINLYSLSSSPPIVSERFPSVSTLSGNKILENPKNRELGSLLHHSSSITALCFPSKSKLLASGEDNVISVTRIRDWNVVSTVKAPQPKTQGRPSGDTAPPGSVPSGINDFAIHPSMKLMLSVGRGERCMRLWNLITGKKAGVLNFNKEISQCINENKRGTGEGRKIVWDSQGEEFAVAFEWGIVVFGVDSTPKCRALPSPGSKIHHIRYFDFSRKKDGTNEFLAVSTEDGRVIFYSTKETSTAEGVFIPDAKVITQVGGKPSGLAGRVKDFEILDVTDIENWKDHFLLLSSGSDGAVRVWVLRIQADTNDTTQETNKTSEVASRLLGTYETGNRITCMVAFVMQKPQALDEIDGLEPESDDQGSEAESSSGDSDQD
ncbi:WD40-repeat-containing domain protein [Talaromyces proteolyticus]|uniref:WD40-repeat-containing domain protein n=1 Tax=Talaromyces proteolyticus TaxID=1131652 RepID=A0AAD4KK68_9EURO|nr:WD40-repeat-containing domain protein [Talaromyces proteolyticus]KAH8693627.1 WD40-repeat-containing domain protein [Talaromyces proteolyticus]